MKDIELVLTALTGVAKERADPAREEAMAGGSTKVEGGESSVSKRFVGAVSLFSSLLVYWNRIPVLNLLLLQVNCLVGWLPSCHSTLSVKAA